MFSGKSVYLRRLQKKDLEKFIKWQMDIEIRFLDDPIIATLESEQGYEKFWEEKIMPDSYAFGIVLKQSDELIGCIGFKKLVFKNRNSEFYILIGEKNYWRKGFGREAMNLLLNYGFMELNLHHIWGSVMGSNERALLFYKSLGFKEEGWLREHLWRHGRWYDVISVGLLASEYNDSL